MDTVPETDPLRQFLSGKRRAERRACDLPVEVRGAAIAFQGRAIDVSEGGVMISLHDEALESVHPEMGMLEAFGVVERYFPHGAQLVFLNESIRVPASVVRLTPPKEGGGVYLGCRFERALTDDEAAQLVAAKKAPPPGPLPLAPRKGVDVFLLLFPGEPSAGPRFVARVLALGPTELDARIEPPRPVTADAVRSDLVVPTLVGRTLSAGASLWEGPLRIVEVRPAISRTPAVDVRVAAGAPLPAALTKRFEPRRT